MPRPNVSEARKAQILAAAAVEFNQQGLASTRMDDIAVRAGVSKGTLYLYFASKDAVVEALIMRAFAPLNEALTALNTQADSIGSVLLRYTEQVLEAFEALRQHQPLVLEFFALAAREPSVRALFWDAFKTYERQIHRLLVAGVALGEFAPHNTEALAACMLTMLDGTLVLSALDATLPLREHGLTGVRLLLAGVTLAPQ